VLFLSGWQIHPTSSGGTLRSFALANALMRRGYDVFAYSMTGRKGDYLARLPSSIQAWPEGIEEYVNRGSLGFLAQYVSTALALPPLWLTAYFKAAAAFPGEVLLPALLREKLAWCNVLLADFPFVHPVFTAASARDKLRVLSTHNLEHEIYHDQTWKSRRLRATVRAIEVEAARACDLLIACCSGDQQFFAAHAPVRRSVLVPNGIDLRRFRGLEGHRARTREALGIAGGVKLFMFTASGWGPNREAFDFVLGFARERREFLLEQGIHILVVGNVVAKPIELPAFTATGRVDLAEPYFAAADAALNPMFSGGGTNVKMCEFLAMRLPILSTPFGARGFSIEDGKTGFLFDKESLAPVLARVRRLFDEDPARLRRMAEHAYTENETAIDMDVSVRPLAEALADAGRR
jgi:glycosyltransferase involved in cell wall biosynthesis